MKISKVKISSILGIQELEFSPGGFVEVRGRNGQGKTGVLEAIKSVFQEGHDATLLRNGADKGEIVLVLDDGTEIRKRVTADSSPRTVHREGGKVARPAEALKAMADLVSINPVDFIMAPKKDRVRVLLESMPISLDFKRLSQCSGIPEPTIKAIAKQPLELIDDVRKSVFDDRTGTNRAIREKQATIAQLEQAMPDAPGGVAGSETELEEQLAALQKARDAELERISTKLAGIKKANADAIAAINAEEMAAIEAARQKAADARSAVINEERIMEGKAATQREIVTDRFHEASAPINGALAAIKADRSAAAKREQAIETIGKMHEELVTLQHDADAQTESLNSIDAYKSELLAALPIPGLEVRAGEVYRDGVAFDRLNTAQQVQIAVEIAKLRAGELKIVCVDRIEMMDSETFEEFKRGVADSGLQLFVTRVTDEDFSLKTNNDGVF